MCVESTTNKTYVCTSVPKYLARKTGICLILWSVRFVNSSVFRMYYWMDQTDQKKSADVYKISLFLCLEHHKKTITKAPTPTYTQRASERCAFRSANEINAVLSNRSDHKITRNPGFQILLLLPIISLLLQISKPRNEAKQHLTTEGREKRSNRAGGTTKQE